MRRLRQLVRAVLPGLLLAVAGVARGQDAPAPGWRSVDLSVDGRPDPLLRGDFNGDGRTDLAAVLGRRLVLYPGHPERGIEPRGQAEVELPRDTVFVTVSSVPQTRGADILLMSPEGIGRLHWTGRGFADKPVMVVRRNTLLQAPSGAEVKYLDFARALDGLDHTVLMVPTRKRLLMLEAGKTLRPRGGIDVLLDVDHYRPSGRTIAGPVTTISYPRPYWGSFTGKGRTEAVVYRRGKLLVHGLGEDGFSPRPTATLELTAAMEGDRGAFRYDYRGLPLDVVDLDGDGLTDVAITQTDKGRTSVFLNRATADGKLPVHQVVQVQGWTLSQKFTDLNGDGLQDLVLVRIDRIGIIQAIKVLLTRSISLTLQVFPARRPEQGKPELTLYDRTPAFTRYVECPLVVSVAENQAEFGLPYVMHVGADYDGDGRGDILASMTPTELGIFRGTDKGLFEDEPAGRIAIPDLRNFKNAQRQITELNGDGRADIILILTGWKPEDDRLIVLISE